MIDLGDTYTSSLEVYTAPPELGGTLVNASAVVLTITLPDGTTVTPAVTSTAVGKYKYDLITTQVGRHQFRWATTGPSTAWTDTAEVRSATPDFIVSLADVKAHLRIAATVTRYDEDLREHIAAATRAVERHLREVVVRRTITQLIEVRYPTRRLLLDSTPVLALTSVTRVDVATTWLLGNLDVDPDGFVVAVRGPEFCGYLRAVYTAGYASVPSNITQAAKFIVEHLWALQQQSELGGGASPFGGSETDSTPSGFGFAIPNRAVELLGARPPFVA